MTTIPELDVTRPRPGVLLITLNRPTSHNAVTIDQQRAIDALLRTAPTDPDVRCIILTGAGGAAFSSGFDIDELVAMTEDEHDHVAEERHELLWRWTTSPVPTVAAVNGFAHGMGTILATTADLRVGGPSTTFKVTAGRYGGANLTWNLPTLIGASATLDLLLTGRAVSSTEAKELGLLNRLVDHDDAVLSAALDLAEDIAGQPPQAMAEIRELVRSGPGTPLRARYEAEHRVMTTTLKPRPMRDVFAGFLARRQERR